jgi:hypothetical protein
MALSKQTVIDKIEVLENGVLQIRRARYIVEDGVRIAGPEYHRNVYVPGADVSAEPPRVQAVAAAVWTPDVILAYQTAQAALVRP